jgi:hypothetical protein
MLPQWVSFAITLLNAIIQVIKLIIELQRQDKEVAKQTPAAIRCARKDCDTTKLQGLLNIVKKEGG